MRSPRVFIGNCRWAARYDLAYTSPCLSPLSSHVNIAYSTKPTSAALEGFINTSLCCHDGAGLAVASPHLQSEFGGLLKKGVRSEVEPSYEVAAGNQLVIVPLIP
jgi:hypothetical protein